MHSRRIALVEDDAVIRAITAAYLSRQPGFSAVLEVQQGGTPFSRAVSRKVLAHFKPSPLQKKELLTPREQQVLSGLVDGLATKDIALRLDLGVGSVRTNIKKIYTTLHVNSRAGLLSRAGRRHL